MDFEQKFYEMADTQPGNWEYNRAMRLLDSIGMNCSPDHYDQTLARHAREAAGDVARVNTESPWIALLEEVALAAEEQQGKEKDLRGYRKNSHKY